ncbi:S-layer homology domain-containing protein [Vallitalea guaymasensis]|uniref:S-layer homology domain-containing protein n=1 Tax=Vallitalea guaymasensis TaxID=1185412 RepID=UPI002357B157|nr:S-layer homology domain-containing protein [Vallitalea guaymasensis]
MLKLKKSICVILPLMLLLTSITSFASSDKTATQLNKLHIIKGNGEDYNLDGQLKRTEAAAFIVRFMGKEKEVLDNKKYYKNTIFMDTIEGQWYIPYVNFCIENKIIDGFYDGTFKPNGPITEKSMLKLILTALGYKYNIDFTWKEVYKKSYEVGLIDDIKKANQTEDNKNYFRRDIVDVLYNALNVNNIKEDKRQIELLIGNKSLTIEEATSAGFNIDTVETSIDSVEVISPDKVKVIFNENISSLENKDIIITEAKNDKKKLTAEVDSIEDNQVIISTQLQGEGTKYQIKIKSIQDNLGGISKDVASEFIGYKIEGIESDEFIISKVVPIDEKTIKVVFTDEIMLAEFFSHCFQILDNGDIIADGSKKELSVANVGISSKEVLVRMTNKTFGGSQNYTVNVKGQLTNPYGLKLNNGKGDSSHFYAVNVPEEKLMLESTEVVDDYTIKLTFNKDLKTTVATNPSHYKLENSNKVPNTIMKARIVNDGAFAARSIYLGTIHPIKENEIYNLYVSGLVDSLNASSFANNIEVMNANSLKAEVNIVYAQTENENVVSLYVDKPLDEGMAINPAFYLIQGVDDGSFGFATPQKIYYNYNLNPYKIVLYLPAGKKIVEGKIYKVTIKSLIKDYLYGTLTSDKTCDFDGTYTSGGLYIADSKIVGSNKVLLEMSENIQSSGVNISTNTYSLTSDLDGTKKTIHPNSVNISFDKYILLEFSNIDLNAILKLEYSSLQDYNGKIYSGTNRGIIISQ